MSNGNHRKISLTAGILYLLTFVSIPSLAFFYVQVKGANYILGSGSDTSAIIGGILEIVVALAGYFAVMFGLIGQHAPITGLFALPVALFEFSLGVWLIAKGFSPKAATALESKA